MRFAGKYFLLIVLLAVFFIMDVTSGSSFIPFSKLIKVFAGEGDVSETLIVLGFRLPKAVAGLTAGMALSVAGLLMQTFFRNPLAGPYVLGVNSLASLFVALFMLGGGSATLVFKWGAPFAASAGALLGLLILLSLSKKIKSTTQLLLIGMMIGFLANALQSVLEYLSNPGDLKNFVLWNMASLSNVTGWELIIFFVIVIFTCSLCFLLIKPLNVLLLGEDQANLLGINTKAVKTAMLVIVAVLSGVTTSYCGPIGFVGLAMPHLVRFIFKTTHHLHQLIGSILMGGCFMLFCDILGNLPLFETTLPVNVITSLFGAPFVLWLIFRNKNNFD